MTFDELLNLVSSDKTLEIRIDSRLVKAGDVFVAIKGTNCDGHDFIGQAIAKGAKYIVCTKNRRQKTEDRRQKEYEIILVEDSSEAAGLLAQAKAGNPASQLINLAVTGTNGKTTTAYLVRSVIQTAGKRCGLIGTVEYDTGSAVCQASMTTPDCLEIACIQKEMVKAGCEYMVIEASSHALSQNRLAGIDFKAAAFTNLTGDHLDYHKTLENYLADKTKLFSALSPDAAAVLNRQSPQSKHIAEKTRARVLWYAIDEPADITAHIESMDINGTVFALQHVPKSSIVNRQSSIVKTLLLGLHNVSNHLAAAGLCLAAGFDLETVAAGLSALQGVPGRLEKVEYTEVGGQGSGFRERAASDERFILRSSPRQVGAATENGRATSDVLVDYAHTDDALKNVLTTLKPLCKGRLIIVFGCGGDRDRTKRPRMAKVAEELADIVIVTSDNPRTEKPEDIINEIVAGFEKGPAILHTELRATSDERRATKIVEPDRRKAIELAIKIAGKDDIVLIAGKGHENYQIIGTKKSPFSDKAVAQWCIEKQIRNWD
ncbi:MAG: UDP-N-acetylmuramoyl-L-alanyl-D-glutamate--2,6-diaminopimelate ligase [Sedimentisphaerales bacterium]|nr:UDP-N-acetylmuramoyl-L-alanyl-D-glutamate--2,6-diaminopimelate ligase [Sedimentisphaerales bacterium]